MKLFIEITSSKSDYKSKFFDHRMLINLDNIQAGIHFLNFCYFLISRKDVIIVKSIKYKSELYS